MTTGVVIRLRNLPLSAGTIDIRHFFNGLRIPDGGVHIIGGDDGTTFILFSTDEDARQAMLRDGQALSGAKIRLTLSSHTEMKNVIEDSQRICEELRGQRPPEPPITNLTNHSNHSALGFQSGERRYQPKPPTPEITPNMLDVNDVHVEIKGMPFSVTESDIVYFFSPLSVSAIRFMLDEKRRKNGTGFVKFGSALEKLEGLKRDRKYIGSRFVKITPASERQWLLASSQPCETVRVGSEPNRKRVQTNTPPSEGTPKRSRVFSPLRIDNCVEVHGLPSSATFKSVGDFFARLRFVESGLFVVMDGNICKGSAFVEFSSYNDYKEALEKDGDMMNGKQVRVIGLSKQNMQEQIRHHKKYIKTKREEEYNRERVQREREKKGQEKKLKDEENLQRKREHQQRKQKDMDEWLRRQHEKEENERKRLDLEKQILNQTMENRKELEQQVRFEEEQRLKQEILIKEDLKKQIEKEEREKIMQEIAKQEEISGAAEMDIEDDGNNEATITTSMPLMQHHSFNATQSNPLGFSTGFGASGSVLASTMPLNFNPSLPVPLVNDPYSLTNISQLPPSFPGTPGPNLMTGKPTILNISQPTIVNPPTLPHPMIPPPQTPPIIIPASHPSMPSVPPPPIPPEPKVSDDYYIRLANSPYNVTEEAIRDFFKGLNIPKYGVQFINKASGRSGHIFIKFATKEDTTKAALKDDQPLMGRNVLVKQATLSVLEQIYTKVTKGGVYKPTFGGDLLVDNFFTKHILDDKLTCVCIGNAPPSVREEDIFEILKGTGIKISQNRVVVMRNAEGKCVGDVYVELLNPGECAKAVNLHGKAKLLGETIRVLPLTSHAMNKDVEGHRLRVEDKLKHHHLNATSASSRNGTLGNPHGPEHFPHKETFPPLYSDVPRFDGPPAYNQAIPPPGPPRDFFSRPMGDLPFPRGDLMMSRSSMADDRLRMPLPPIMDVPFGIPPPPLGPRFPLNRPPFPLNPAMIRTVKMSNLSFAVTREDILEFFAPFDALPDSVRLMYNNKGKPTGDGIVAFPNIDAARAAIEKRNAHPLLKRKIKLYLQ